MHLVPSSHPSVKSDILLKVETLHLIKATTVSGYESHGERKENRGSRIRCLLSLDDSVLQGRLSQVVLKGSGGHGVRCSLGHVGSS